MPVIRQGEANMKLIIGLIASLLLLPVRATELRLWHQKEEGRVWLPQLAKQYEQQTGTRVRVSFMPTGELRAALLRGAIENNSPDIAIVPADFIGDHQRLKLVPLTQEWFSASVSGSLMPTVTLEQLRYGVPLLSGNHLMLFYNKQFVESPAATWQELQQQAGPLRAKGIEPIGWKYGEMYWFTAFLTAFGGFPVNDNQITLDTVPMRETLAFYKHMADSGLVDAKCDYDCTFDDFKNGKYAYTINGDWAFHDMSEALGDDFGVAVLPSINGAPMQPAYSGMAMIFPAHKGTQNASKLVLEFAHFMQSKQVQSALYHDLGLLPVHREVISRIMNEASGNVRASLRQLDNGRSLPPSPALTASWLGMRKGFELYMSGHGSAEQASQLMQRFAEHELDKKMKPIGGRH